MTSTDDYHYHNPYEKFIDGNYIDINNEEVLCFKNNKPHNLNGPAKILKSISCPFRNYYFIDGVEYIDIDLYQLKVACIQSSSKKRISKTIFKPFISGAYKDDNGVVYHINDNKILFYYNEGSGECT